MPWLSKDLKNYRRFPSLQPSLSPRFLLSSALKSTLLNISNLPPGLNNNSHSSKLNSDSKLPRLLKTSKAVLSRSSQFRKQKTCTSNKWSRLSLQLIEARHTNLTLIAWRLPILLTFASCQTSLTSLCRHLHPLKNKKSLLRQALHLWLRLLNKLALVQK